MIATLGRTVQRLLRPARSAGILAIGASRDLTRTRSALLADNALLRQQLIVLRRSIARPRLHRDDRLLLLLLARLNCRWREALHLVSPETFLRWHRDLFKIVWRRKSRPKSQPKRLAPEVVALIQAMAKDPYNFGDNFDSFFSDSEFFKHIELGWTTSKDLIYLDNVHLTAWHADQRHKAGVPDGWGIAFSAAKFIDEKWLPFLRAGYSDDGGALWEYSVSGPAWRYDPTKTHREYNLQPPMIWEVGGSYCDAH